MHEGLHPFPTAPHLHAESAARVDSYVQLILFLAWYDVRVVPARSRCRREGGWERNSKAFKSQRPSQDLAQDGTPSSPKAPVKVYLGIPQGNHPVASQPTIASSVKDPKVLEHRAGRLPLHYVTA